MDWTELKILELCKCSAFRNFLFKEEDCFYTLQILLNLNAVWNNTVWDTQFLKSKWNWSSNVLEIPAEFFPAALNHSEVKVAEEYCWTMTRSGAVVLQPVRSQCIAFQISSGLPCIYVYIWLYKYSNLTCPKFDLCQTFQNITAK
jgi:hypothetical protein